MSHVPFSPQTDTPIRRRIARAIIWPARLGVFLLAVVLLLGQTALPSRADGGGFDALTRRAATEGAVKVIVGMDLPAARYFSDIQRQADVTRAQVSVLRNLPPGSLKAFRTFKYQPYMALSVDAAGLKALSIDSAVTSIEADALAQMSLSTSTPLIGADAAWGQGYTGSGWAVAILDTGVDNAHPFLMGKVVDEACYSTTYAGYGSTSLCPGGIRGTIGPNAALNCDTAIAGCDHGTHVAGIAAGKGGSFSGVAKDATIIAVQVFSRFDNPSLCNGSSSCVMSYTSDQIAGLERVYALRNTYNIASINMSLGGGKYTAPCDSSAIAAYIDALYNMGIATVIAAGNNGYADGLSAPACVSSAVSVGSTTSYGAGSVDSVSYFSNSAYFLDLLAPGHFIYSSVPGGGYGYKAGTSMAAPQVTGAWAVLKSKADASVADILSALTGSGVSITDNRNNLTKPRIQIDAALTALSGPTPTPTATPTAPTVTPSATATTTPPPVGTVTPTPNPTPQPGNHAPQLDNSGSPSLAVAFEGQTDPAGSAVTDLIASGAGGNPITDADPGALEGLAVTAADNRHGTWQFSTDGGASWTDFDFAAHPFGPFFSLSDLSGANGVTLTGIDGQDQAGWSVSGLGDVNGDGLADVIVGANLADRNNTDPNSNEGEAYVLFGSPLLENPLSLAGLTGANGFTLEGVTPAGFAGQAVAGLGDVNGDGLADFAVAVPQDDPGGRTDAGAVAIIFGAASFPAGLSLDGLTGANGFVFQGKDGESQADYGDKAGYAVAGAGDVNGDGFDDMLIGAPFANPAGVHDAGQSYVIFGHSGTFPATVSPADLTGGNGFALNGAAESGFAGHAVSGAGDVNGDGFDDMLVGAPHFVGIAAGEAYLVFGRSAFSATVALNALGANGVTLPGLDDFDSFGWAVAGTGDVNGDGLADFAIGAPGAAPADRHNAGEAYLIFGKNTFSATLDVSVLDGASGLTLAGGEPWDAAGHSLAGAGDVNGDGLADLLVGAPGHALVEADKPGLAHVVFGQSGGFPSGLTLNALDGSSGATVVGLSNGNQTGFDVAGAGGDVNGDGFDDMLIGAPTANTATGQAYLIFGPARATVLSDSPADRIRFVPDPGFTGSATVTFRAWDRTDGATGGQQNVAIGGTGGEWAFSAAVEQATVTVAPSPPDLYLEQTVEPVGAWMPGQAVTITLTVGNHGPATATDVTVSDAIPPVLTGLSASGAGVAFTPTGSLDFAWLVQDLIPGQSGTMVVTGIVSPALVTDTAFSNVATIGSPALEADTGNNSAVESRSVLLPRAAFSRAGYSVAEGGTAAVTVTLSAPPAQSTVVTASIAAQTAGAGSDFSAGPGRLTFAPGQTQRSLSIVTHDDFLDESDETIGLTLTGAEGALPSGLTAATLTIIDDDETITGLTADSSAPDALGHSTALTAGITTGNNVSFAWNFGDGTTGAGATVAHTYPATGTYTAVVTAANVVNVMTATTTVVIEEGVSGLNLSAGSPVELGQPMAFSATVSSGSNVQFQWNFGDGATGTGSTANHTYAAVGSYTVTGTAFNGAGSVSAQMTVTVLDVPLAGLTLGNDGPTPWGAPTVLTASVGTGSNAVFTWDFGDGTTGVGAISGHVYPGIGMYTATVSAANSRTQLTGATVVTITDVPIAGLTILSSAPTMLDKTTAFTAALSAGSNVTFTWQFGDGATGAGPWVSHRYPAVGSYPVTLVARNPMGAVTATTTIHITPRYCWVRLNNDPTDYFAVQPAIDAATAPTDVVKVAGHCTAINTLGGSSQSVYLNKSITVQGGYTHTNWLAADPATHISALDAGGHGRVVFVAGGSPTLDGLHLTGGDAAGLGGTPSNQHDAGGGLYLAGGTVILHRVVITGNRAEYGAGAYLSGAAATISDSHFEQNIATQHGGGLYLYNSPSSLTDVTIRANQGYYGGGLYLFGSAASVNRAFIIDNVSTRYGGGLYLQSSDATLSNAVIVGNQAANTGSGLYVKSSSPQILQAVIGRNTGGQGDGLYAVSAGPALKNVIIGGQTVGVNAASGSVAMQGTLWGDGPWANTVDWQGAVSIAGPDLRGDPAFVDGDGGDFHLSVDSPALDAGIDSGVTTDIDGGHRPAGGNFDIGVDEVPSALSVFQQAGPNPVRPGQPLTITVRVSNLEAYSLTVSVADTLPPQVAPNAPRAWSAVLGPVTGTWQTDFVVTVDAGFIGPMNNVVRVSTHEGEVVTNTLTVLVERPIVGLSAASNSPTELGRTTVLTASVADGSNVTYHWAFGDGSTATGATVSHVYPAVGTYTAVVTAGNAFGGMAAQTLVTITDERVTGLSAANSSPTEFGQSTLLTATVSGGSHVDFTWDLGDGTTAIGPAIDHIYPAVGAYTATVTAQNGAGTQTAQTHVTIIDVPVAGLRLDTSAPTPNGSATVFTAGVSAGSGLSYAWQFGDGATGAGQSTAHTYPAVGDYVVWLTASNSRGSATISDTVTIFNQPPQAVLRLTPSAGTTATLVTADAGLSTDPNGDGLIYTFNFGGEAIIGPQSAATATHTFAVSATHTVVVTVSDADLSDTAAHSILIANPSLRIKKIGPSKAIAGERVVYTLIITNNTPVAAGADAILDVNPKHLYFNMVEGDDAPTPQSVSIANTGDGLLLWQAIEQADWLSLDKLSGSAPDALGVSVAGSLPEGRYDAQIVIDGGLAQNSPQVVDVTLNVYCADRQPVDVVLALDRSGSMWGLPFQNAQSAVKQFVDLMDLSADQVGLVSFSGIAVVEHHLTQDGAAVKTTVDGLRAGGMTNIAEAINDAHAELLSARRNPANTPVLVLLSDGSQTVAGDPLAEANAAKADGLRIITIGLGRANTTVLQAIASSPGDYYYAPTSADLQAIYQLIAATVGCAGGGSTVWADAFSAADPYAPTFPQGQLPNPLPAQLRRDEVALTNLVISDILPDGAVYVAGGALAGNTVRWTIPSLAANTSVRVQFAVTATHTITNRHYRVDADGGYRAIGTEPVVTLITPRPAPALSLEMWPSAGVITGAQTVQYSYRVRNTGNITLTDVIIDDSAWGFIDGLETLSPGASADFSLDATVIEATTNVATATAASSYGPAMDTATATVEFVPVRACGATIESVGSGHWKDPATWSPARVPGQGDIVLVNKEHTVTVRAHAHTRIKALCNYGTLQGTDKQQLYIGAAEFLFNYGTIIGQDGRGGADVTNGHPGNNLKLEGAPITNWGVIQAGNGGDGDRDGGNGGSVMVFGRNTTNYGVICAGAGGDILGPKKGNHGGKGGHTYVWGNHGGPGMLLNTGTICAGDGGNGSDSANDDQRGGDGGDLKLISEPDVLLSGGRYYAGRGGAGTGGGQDGRDGRDGRIFIEPTVISLAGPHTEMRGGDIVIFGGNDWTLDLSNMNGAAISATGRITLAVGAGGSVDLRNNGFGGDILRAGGGVHVAADAILLDNGASLPDVLGSQATSEPARVLHNVSVDGPALLDGALSATLPLSLTVMNVGPQADTIALSWAATDGVQLSGLPATLPADGLTAQVAQAAVSLPGAAPAGGQSVLTVTVASQAQPDVTAAHRVVIQWPEQITTPTLDNHVYLPLVMSR